MSDERCEFAKAKNEEIRNDTLREVREAIQEALPMGKLTAEKDSQFIVKVVGWFRKGGRFEVRGE